MREVLTEASPGKGAETGELRKLTPGSASQIGAAAFSIHA